MVDIMSKVRISMFDALLGGSVKVKTLSGFKSLKINPSTQSGTIYRIEKGGMANRGNHLVEINVEILNNLTEEQKELVIKLKETVNKEDI
jgi:DnaJ-class molecular chaperone